jgi:hypothetical protein
MNLDKRIFEIYGRANSSERSAPMSLPALSPDVARPLHVVSTAPRIDELIRGVACVS